MVTRRSAIGAVAFAAVVFSVTAQTPATAYLQQTSDRYQHTVDVYADADTAGNHFAARGEFHAPQGDAVPAMDEISAGAPCLGITCITATYNPATVAWGGWYFMNGVLGATAQTPSLNWGTVPNAGYDLAGATVLRFLARGLRGGEVVHFLAFGVGNTQAPYMPYPDSSRRVESGPITLATTWTQYQINLAGHDIHYVLGGFGWFAVASEQSSSEPLTFYLDDIQYVKARPADPRFLVSYETISSGNAFDAVMRNPAFVYDNAVALIALNAAGDLTHAGTIADALLYAQLNDRYFTDGRVRNACQGGDIMLPPGWLPDNKPNTVRMPGWYDAGHAVWYEDETQVSSSTGNVAWAMLALMGWFETTHEQRYLQAAQQLGGWVIANTRDDRGQGGFTGGYDGWEVTGLGAGEMCPSGVYVNGQCKRLYKSTEHNIDLYAAFSRLCLLDNQPQWAQAAQHAKIFFLSMFDPTGGKFWTGTDEGGVNPSTDVIPLDIQVWSIEALGSEAQPYLRTLDYIEANHKTALGYGFKQNGGNTCGDNTWFEGTSQVAVAYALLGDTAKWRSILNGVRSAQWPSGAMPATDGPCLNTGFSLNDNQPWLYYPRAHVGATAWLSLAENMVNPYRADLYSPRLGPARLSFGSQIVGTASAARSLTLSNPGTAPLAIGGISTAGTNASDFHVSSTCGSSVAVGGSCEISVSFTPGASGRRSAFLTVTETGGGALLPIPLNGTGRTRRGSTRGD